MRSSKHISKATHFNGRFYSSLAVMTVSARTRKCFSTDVSKTEAFIKTLSVAELPEFCDQHYMHPTTRKSEMSETEAIERAKNGDLAGLGRLYALHRSRVYALCLRCTKNVFDAEDLTQDVFLLVARKVNTFRGDSQFTSWLHQVAMNLVYLHERRRRRQGQVITDNQEVLGDVPARCYNPAQRIALEQALSGLTPARRETVLLHDIEGLTHDEVAWRMGISAVASKSRLHQAHTVLRNMLGKALLAHVPADVDVAD